MMADAFVPFMLGPNGLWGYLDPGSGSVLFQILIAGLMSGLFCLRSSVQGLKRVFSRGQEDSKAQENA